jgi:hypothetical protein
MKGRGSRQNFEGARRRKTAPPVPKATRPPASATTETTRPAPAPLRGLTGEPVTQLGGVFPPENLSPAGDCVRPEPVSPAGGCVRGTNLSAAGGCVHLSLPYHPLT